MKKKLEKGKTMGKILLVMYAVTALLLFLLALIVQKLQLEGGAVSIGISVIDVVSCFVGGFLAGKIQKTKKFLWGLFLGLVYLLILFLVTVVAKEGGGMNFSELAGNLLLCLGGGMLGGMLS